MAATLDINPTRGNLLRIREELKGIRMRHDLLDRKKDVIVRELMQRTDRAKAIQDKNQELFRKARRAVQMARIRMGSDQLEWIVRSPAAHPEVKLGNRTIIGIKIPVVQIDMHPVIPPYDMTHTSVALDQAREQWLEVLNFAAESSEVLISVWRLARELKKVQRQVNALESTIMPRYENTIRFIESRLEEEEREDIVHAKLIKEMRE